MIVGVEGVDDVKASSISIMFNPFYVPTDDDEIAARAAIQLAMNPGLQRLADAENRGLVVKRAPPGRVVMNKPQVFESSEQVALDLAAPLEAIRVWIIEDAGGAPGASVVTGISFLYRGSDAFVPEAPDAAEDAARRNGNPYVYIEQTATLAKGERVISVKWYSNLQNICRVIAFATNQGRELKFGSNGTLLPDLPPDEASVGGAPLVGMHGFRELTAPQVDIGAFRAGDIDAFHDVYGGADFQPVAFYFATAWKRRRSLVLLKALVKKGKAKAPGTLWPRVLDADFEEGLWRHVVRCL